MTKNKDNKPNDEVIIVTDDAGMQLYLSEKAANRFSWILTGICVVLSLPVIILAFMCIYTHITKELQDMAMDDLSRYLEEKKIS